MSTPVESGMTYCCGTCQEVMGKAPESENKNPFLVTKCGHLFHFVCLNQWFSKSGDNVAWGPKTCPTCKISLTIGTDVIRIFPTSIAQKHSTGKVVESQQTVNELVTQVAHFKKQIVELARRLEVSFLKERESEQTVAYFRSEMDNLDAKLRVEINDNAECRSYINWLNTESHHLKNTVMSLTNSLMECQHRMQLIPPRPFHPFAPRPTRFSFPQMLNNQQGPRRNFPPPVFSSFGNSNPGILGPGYLHTSTVQSQGSARFPIQSLATNPAAKMISEGLGDGLSSMGEDSQLSTKFSEVSLNPLGKDVDGSRNEAGSLKIINVKSEDVLESNGNLMTIELNEKETNVIENIDGMANADHDSKIENDVNDNRIEHGMIGIGKQSFWKYRCEKCDLYWENRGGQNPLTSFCHGCHKIISPYSQVPIKD